MNAKTSENMKSVGIRCTNYPKPIKSKLGASGLKRRTTPHCFIFVVVCSTFMTTQDYIDNNKTATFKKGDKVIMHTCGEADYYKGKVWECMTDSYKDKGGSDVVFLKDFSGCFSTKFLQRVQI